MQFEFATAQRIVFGRGCLAKALDGIQHLGARALVVTGRNPDRAEPLLTRLGDLGIVSTTLGVSGEPSLETLLAALRRGLEFNADFLVGFGGGSALDTAKALAALLPNPGDPLDYLEVVGRGRPLAQPALACVAVPTTAGTGAEVTKNAVIACEQQRVKVSLRDASMLPRLAIVDSELTLSMPRDLTAATGLDALTQCIEPYISCLANPLTDGLALEGIRRAAKSLRRAYFAGHDADARDDMAMASLFGGLALANAKLGAVHGFAGPIGGLTNAPHGAVCARLLPLVFAHNAAALEQRATASPILERMTDVARILTGDPNASRADGAQCLAELVRDLEIPGLGAYGLDARALEGLVAQAKRSSSMRGNPIELTDAELSAIAERALDAAT